MGGRAAGKRGADGRRGKAAGGRQGTALGGKRDMLTTYYRDEKASSSSKPNKPSSSHTTPSPYNPAKRPTQSKS